MDLDALSHLDPRKIQRVDAGQTNKQTANSNYSMIKNI